MVKMRAVQLFKPGDLRCVDVEKPEIENKDEVIVKVKACGVCGSDLSRVMVKGAYRHPITIGHEFSGVIDDAGNNAYGLAKGDRVTVVPLIPCEKCDYCKIGQHILCDNYSYYGSREDGAMAEYVKVRAENIIIIPLNVDFESAAMTEPTAVALHAIRKSRMEPGQNAAVIGLGAIGLLAVQWLAHSGCSEIYAIDIFDKKLKLAERLGADFCINGKKENLIDVIEAKTNKKGLDIVIELAGSKFTQVQSINLVRKLGKIVFCGISYDELVIPNKELSKILRHELEIIGAWNSLISPLPVNEWISSLKFMQMGKVKCNPIISHRYRLEQCSEAFDMMFNKKEVFNKVIFKPED